MEIATVSVKRAVLIGQEWEVILSLLNARLHRLKWGTTAWVQTRDTIRAIEEQTGFRAIQGEK